jgi:arsenate reductase
LHRVLSIESSGGVRAGDEGGGVKYVLFVCNHNAARRRCAPSRRARSRAATVCGANVVEAMREVGIDLSARRPKKLEIEMRLHPYGTVTLACGARCPFAPTVVEDWDIPDPAEVTVDETRPIRDGECLRREHCDAVALP